jgi:hypothetical protein
MFIVEPAAEGFTAFGCLLISQRIPFTFSEVDRVGLQQSAFAEVEFVDGFVVFHDAAEVTLVSIATGDFRFKDSADGRGVSRVIAGDAFFSGCCIVDRDIGSFGATFCEQIPAIHFKDGIVEFSRDFFFLHFKDSTGLSQSEFIVADLGAGQTQSERQRELQSGTPACLVPLSQ